MSPGSRPDPLAWLLSRLHLLLAAVPLLFLGAALLRAAGADFRPGPEDYPRVRYAPHPTAEVLLQSWRRWKVQAASRVVAVWGLADASARELDAAQPGLATARILLERGAQLRVCEPRFPNRARSMLNGPAVRHFEDPYEAARGATDLLLNSDQPAFRNPDFPRLAKAMRGRALFDCLEAWDGPAARAAGLHWFPVGGPGWPPWLDPEFQSFVAQVRRRTPPDARILLYPTAPLTSPSPRARWYLLLNWALAPRALLLPGPELASGTAPQYQRWVRERNSGGLLQGEALRTALRQTRAEWILGFHQSPDFRLQDWKLQRAPR